MEFELTPVSARWKKIGSALRLKANVLDMIETANQGNPDKCLSQAIVEWLRLNYNVERFGRPSWKWVVEVVAHPAGGNNTDLAMKIARKYQGTSRMVEERSIYVENVMLDVTKHLACGSQGAYYILTEIILW